MEEKNIYLLNEYLQLKFDLLNFKKSEYIGVAGKEITYIKNSNNLKKYFNISFNKMCNEIRLLFEIEIIIPTESLADPKCAYLTTSASRFKTKRIKLDKHFDDLEKAKKNIDKYINKINNKGIE